MRVFDPARQCGVPRRSSDEKARRSGAPPGRKGEPCRNWKGYRTDHAGSGNCYLHAGSSPAGKADAASERAAKALAGLGQPIAIDPQRALLQMVHWSYGRLAAIVHQISRALDTEKPDAAVVGALKDEFGAERDRMVRTAKVTIEADIAERQAKINEEIGRAMARAIEVGLDAAGVSGGRRRAALQAAVDELHRIDAEAPVGVGLN